MPYEWLKVTRADVIPGMDYKLTWILGPGAPEYFRYIPSGNEQYLPVVYTVENPNFLPDDFLRATGASEGRLTITREALEKELASQSNENRRMAFARAGISLTLSAPCTPDAPESTNFNPGPKPAEQHKWPQDTVLVGVIDDGLAFANDAFRDNLNQTRIQYFWWQDGTDLSAPQVPYGTEYSKLELDNSIAAAQTLEADDTYIYRSRRHIHLSKQRIDQFFRRSQINLSTKPDTRNSRHGYRCRF